jgi:hypothetical protein
VTASSPPGRAVLRLAGILTQLICASALLLGTIAFVLVQQNKSGGAAYVIAWAVAALIGLVFGGLIGRGGMISLIGCTVLDAAFGIVLLALDNAVLKGLVRVLPASDVEMIASILVGAGGAMIAVAVLCLLSIPQALRYAKWLRGEAEREDREAQLAAQPSLAARHSAPRPSQMTYTLSSQHSGLQVRPSPNAIARGSAGIDPMIPSSASTAKGWTPHTAKISVWHMPAATPEETRSRRRLYFALAGFAIGFGAGIGVLVSSTQKRRDDKVVMTVDAGVGSAVAAPDRDSATDPDKKPDAGAVVASTKDGPIGDGGALEDKPATPAPSVQTLVQAQRVAIANADPKALVATLAPSAIGFGVDADELGEGRDALAAHVERDLGDLPANGFSVESKFTLIGEAQNHAWIALELEVSAPGRSTRRFAITQLAAALDGKWQVVAWHWAVPVPDSQAEKLAILGTLPSPKPVANLTTGPKELETAVRAAFASRAAFAEARSTHEEGFNFGSAPNERIVGGTAVKRVFGRLKAEIKPHDGMRIVAGDSWDPAQKDAPFIAFAVTNVDFTMKTRAATDLTQTFRVLAILLKEGSEWKIVLTQWSHGGPIR